MGESKTRRRLGWLVLWLVVGAAAAPALAQDEAAPDAPFQFVCLKESEPAVSVIANAAPPGETWERRGDVRGVRAPAHCWAWSDACPPLLLAPGEDAAAACRSAGASSTELTIRIGAREGSGGDSGDGGAAPREFHVTAAPAAMWRQVPRRLLPTTITTSRLLALPRASGAWRTQARSDGLASTWLDATAEEDSVEFELWPAVDLTVQATADGALLAGARVSLVRAGSGMAAGHGGELLGFGIADADGRVRLTVSERERAAVVVSNVSRTAAAFERFADVPPVVELGPGLAVRGRTVDVVGQPLAGVRLLGLS